MGAHLRHPLAVVVVLLYNLDVLVLEVWERGQNGVVYPDLARRFMATSLCFICRLKHKYTIQYYYCRSHGKQEPPVQHRTVRNLSCLHDLRVLIKLSQLIPHSHFIIELARTAFCARIHGRHLRAYRSQLEAGDRFSPKAAAIGPLQVTLWSLESPFPEKLFYGLR